MTKDLIIPLLKDSVTYDRGVGYFSLHSIASLSSGIIPYIKNGGIIRVITSIALQVEDIDYFEMAYELAETMAQEELLKAIDVQLDEKEIIDMDLITNLIAANKIILKIAYLPSGGIYHEKIAYFEDSVGDAVWFAGSTNETYNAYHQNIESLIVIKSWDGDHDTIFEQKAYFSSLWSGNNPTIQTIELPSAIRKKLFEKYKKSENYQSIIEELEKEPIPRTRVHYYGR